MRSLTDQQLRVIRLLWAGLTHKEVGDNLGVSESTVDFHVGEMFKRSSTNAIVPLLRWALHHRYLRSDPLPDSLSQLLDARNRAQADLLDLDNEIQAYVVACAARLRYSTAPLPERVQRVLLNFPTELVTCRPGISSVPLPPGTE